MHVYSLNHTYLAEGRSTLLGKISIERVVRASDGINMTNPNIDQYL